MSAGASDEAARLQEELGFVPPRRRGGQRAKRQLRALTAKLDAGELTREELEGRPSRTLFALGLSAHPVTGQWAGEEAPGPQPVDGPPTPPPPPTPPAQEEEEEELDAVAAGPQPALLPLQAKSSTPTPPPPPSRARVPPAPPQPPRRRAVLSAADPVAQALASSSAGRAARDEPPAPTAEGLKRCPEVLRGSIVKSRRTADEEEEEPLAPLPRRKSAVAPATAGGSADISPSSVGSSSSSEFLFNLISSSRLALDFHGVLDVGKKSRVVPSDEVVASVARLAAHGFTLWVCSYIGRFGADSDRFRAECREFCENLAHAANLNYPVDKVTKGGLYIHICNYRTGTGGKAQTLRERGTRILFDDRLEIATEAEQAGIVTYQVCPAGKRNKFGAYVPTVRGIGPHRPCEDLATAVDRVISDDTRGIGKTFVLDNKLRIFDEHKQW